MLGVVKPSGDDVVAELVTSLADEGFIFVVAAGNDNKKDGACNSTPQYLSPKEKVIVVGAVDDSGKKAFFSNWGKCVDLYAPGNEIEVASKNLPGSGGFLGFFAGTGYTTMSGTSFCKLAVPSVPLLLTGS